jgi:type IV secretion system protein VirB10
MRLPGKNGANKLNDNADPRDGETAEIIDLASRTAYPAVTQRSNRSDGMGLAAGAAIVGLLGAVTLWSMNSARVDEPQPTTAIIPAQAVPAAMPAPVVVQPEPIAPSFDPAPSPVFANQPNIAPVPVANPYGSPTMVFDASTSANARPSTGTAPVGADAAAPATGGALGSAEDFASRVGGVGGAPAQAKAMVNPATTVTQGTLIPAILETAIDTNVPGYVRAVVSQDVRSFDGTKILVPRSSRLIGQYQSGLQGGQKRAYVIWSRLIRPDGASVNLASPAIGFDGTTGLAGEVESNFFKRFGSAMLLSVVGGLSAIGTGGASVVLGGGGQAAAAAAVEQDSKIGPTIRVRMGEPIRVFTARDLDFSGVS